MAVSPRAWWWGVSARPQYPRHTTYAAPQPGEMPAGVLTVDDLRTATALGASDADDAAVLVLEEAATKDVEDVCNVLLRQRTVHDYYAGFSQIMRLSARSPSDVQMGADNFASLTVGVAEDEAGTYAPVDAAEWRVDYAAGNVALTFDTIPSYSWEREIALPVMVTYKFTPGAVPPEIHQALQFAARARANVVYRGHPFMRDSYKETIAGLCGPYASRGGVF